MTNGSKAKAGSSTAATKPAATKPTAAAAPAGSSTRRTYRTRSSTGGATSAVKEEPIREEGEGEEASDAMAIDGADDVKPARQIKSLKRTAAGTSKTVTGTTAATRRPALAAKRANSASTSTAREAKGKAVAAVKQTPPVVREARRRRAEAEERHRAALEELEEAKLEEEQLEAELAMQRELEAQGGRVAKKARTSEPEYAKEFADEEDDFIEVDAGARVSKYETEVEPRPKDEGWEDLDVDDDEDPLMVSAYVVEVYEYLRELEVRPLLSPLFFAYSPTLSCSSRRCPSRTTCRTRTR